MQPLLKPILVYNTNRTPNKAGAISSMVDLVLYYQNHAKHAVSAITSLGRQNMILGFTWLCEHNPKTMMNNIFWDLIAEGIVCVYLNDILIYTKTLEEHGWITCLVLEHLCQYQLYLKLEKFTEMDTVKVAGVTEWLEPKNKKEVQAFFSFVNFY
ncbi:hypothetical protein E4T56_gene20122 [Termitomyces sp. T112]|nr:hypothetical protein E4T56_gene20122 [Termitomyces sp. T112]